MKKISKESAERMIKALEYALDRVRDGTCLGICGGIEYACISVSIISRNEKTYLTRWIRRMLRPCVWLEGHMKILNYDNTFNTKLRYERRKPWVEWMIQHLKETT